MKELDVQSPTWRCIERTALGRIDTLRQKNDLPSLDAIRTAELRGRIAAWKELLALAQEPTPETLADAGAY